MPLNSHPKLFRLCRRITADNRDKQGSVCATETPKGCSNQPPWALPLACCPTCGVSITGGSPQSSMFSRIFPDEPSSYWATPMAIIMNFLVKMTHFSPRELLVPWRQPGAPNPLIPDEASKSEPAKMGPTNGSTLW